MPGDLLTSNSFEADLISDNGHALWLGGSTRLSVTMPKQTAGLYTLEIACKVPRYATLHVEFEDENLAPLVVALDRSLPERYRKTFSLIGPARRAWINLEPALYSNDDVTISVAPVSWTDLAKFAVSAVRRHAGAPCILMGKIGQVISGGGNLVFSGNQIDNQMLVGDYKRWQEAFESDVATCPVISRMKDRIGHRDVRVLAVVVAAQLSHLELVELLDSLATGLSTQLAVLSLTAADPRLELPGALLTDVWRPYEWEHVDSKPDDPLHVCIIKREVERVRADLVIFLDRPGRFHSLTAVSLWLALELEPKALAVYADHDAINSTNTRENPVFKPAWSPVYEAAWNYVAQPVAFRANSQWMAELGTVGSLRCPSYSLLMRLPQKNNDRDLVAHVPRVLFHQRRQPPGDIRHWHTDELRIASEINREIREDLLTHTSNHHTSLHRVNHLDPASNIRISVLIPSKNNHVMLEKAYKAVIRSNHSNTEVVIVDNGSTSPTQLSLLNSLAEKSWCKVISDPGPFNFSRLVNVGRAHCSGEIIVLLNDDVEMISVNWLGELITYAMRPEIGCVGALLLYPDGRVQHAGVVLGINGGAAHAFRFVDNQARGADHRLRVTREVSAVTGACLAVRKSVFDEVGGFTEALPVTYNDIDFCLKVLERGYRNIITPHAKLVHRESITRGLDSTPEKLLRLSKETAIFKNRWGEAASNDIYYSPHLSRSHEDFRCRTL